MPNSHHLKKQKLCHKSENKIVSKKHSHKEWLKRPKNRDCFSYLESVSLVQQWHERNPDYWKRKEPTKRTLLFEDALQDMLSAKKLVCIDFKPTLTNSVENYA